MLILISLMNMHHVSSLPYPSIYPYLAALIGGDENACRLAPGVVLRLL
jgi:hypothetical protein